MTDETRNKLERWTEMYSRTSDGAWLNDLRGGQIDMEWSDRCNAENGILGKYSFGRIILMECENCPDQIWPTLIHELWHYWQFKKSPIRYILFKMKIYRWKIEDSGDEETARAEKWIEANG